MNKYRQLIEEHLHEKMESGRPDATAVIKALTSGDDVTWLSASLYDILYNGSTVFAKKDLDRLYKILKKKGIKFTNYNFNSKGRVQELGGN